MSLQDSTQGYILSSPRTVFTLPSIIVVTLLQKEGRFAKPEERTLCQMGL